MFCNLLAEVHRHTLVLMTLDQAEEVFSEHLEYHADMCAIWSFMLEMVEERDDV